MTTLAVDCMGGDHGAAVILPACRSFLDRHAQARLVLVGQPEDKATAFAFLYNAINFITMNILGVIGLRGIGSTWQNDVSMARSFRRKEVSGDQ